MRGKVRTIVAVWLALLVLGVPAALANACGQTTTVSPRRSLGPGAAPLAIGDSVLYDAAQALSYYGFEINAMVCRTMAQGIVWLQDDARNLPVLVVVALGTNGSVTSAQIDQLLSIVGPNRILAMVTPHDGNYAYVPGLIRAAAQQNPGRIELLDWDRLSTGHPNWFAPDGIHLGSSAGINAFARLVAGALVAAPTQASATSSIQPGPIAAPHTIAPAPQPAPARPKPTPARAALLALAAVDRLYSAVSTSLTL